MLTGQSRSHRRRCVVVQLVRKERISFDKCTFACYVSEPTRDRICKKENVIPSFIYSKVCGWKNPRARHWMAHPRSRHACDTQCHRYCVGFFFERLLAFESVTKANLSWRHPFVPRRPFPMICTSRAHRTSWILPSFASRASFPRTWCVGWIVLPLPFLRVSSPPFTSHRPSVHGRCFVTARVTTGVNVRSTPVNVS